MNEEEIAAGLAATPGYRYAERTGDELFVAGQVPLDSGGEMIGPGDVALQAKQCLDNLATLLGVHGFGLDDIKRLTIHVVGDQPLLAEAWAAVVSWFVATVPPATLLGVGALGYAGQLVEVDAVIIRNGREA